MNLRGECLACRKIGNCLQTSVDKAWWGFTCPLFEEVSEPEYLARINAMEEYGDVIAIRAMLNRPEGEEDARADT